ncbi:MAG: hypothetical protein JXR97_14670 [Planctomycetes bacterium]|nr:hypothetical protein [Planctomycetota bacterium]
MKRIIGMAEIEAENLHLAIFEINGKNISLVTEETLGPHDSTQYPGLDVWLIVRTCDRSIRYVNLPKDAKRQARKMAMMQASPLLPLEMEEYAYDALIKPVGDKLGALVIAIPLEKAHEWERRLEAAGLVLVSFAIEPLFYPLIRPPQPGKIAFCIPTTRGSLAIIGCNNGTPVCWTTIQDDSQLPACGLENLLVQEYFCEKPEPFVPEKLLTADTTIEPRLVGYLAAAHLASMSPRPWEGRSILAFSDFLKREQYAPATMGSILKCAAIWAAVALIMILAGIAHVRKTEKKAERMSIQSEQLKVFAKQSTQAAQEISSLMDKRNSLYALTLGKPMALDVLKSIQDSLPYRVRMTDIRYDADTGVQAECIAEKEPDILLLLGNLGKQPNVKNLRLLFAEAREDGFFRFRIEFSFGALQQGSKEIAAARRENGEGMAAVPFGKKAERQEG